MLEVVRAAVPERLADPAGQGAIHQAAPGRALLDLPLVGRVLVEDGRRATVEPAVEASADDVAWFVGGLVTQVGWLQSGTLALRASAVVIGGRAVALLGVAAAGKSAVAAALALRGNPVLADSALPVQADGGRLVARGVADELELWPAAIDELGLDPATGRTVRPGLAKRRYVFPAAEAAPLRAVVLLERATSQGAPFPERVSGSASSRLVAHRTAMAPLLGPLGLRAAHFRWVTRIAAAAEVYRLRVDRHRRDLGSVADAVEGLVT